MRSLKCLLRCDLVGNSLLQWPGQRNGPPELSYKNPFFCTDMRASAKGFMFLVLPIMIGNEQHLRPEFTGTRPSVSLHLKHWPS